MPAGAGISAGAPLEPRAWPDASAGPPAPARCLRDERAGLEQLLEPREPDPAGGAQLALADRAFLLDDGERGALPRAEPWRRHVAAPQPPARRRRAGHVHAIGDAHPALAPVARRQTLEGTGGELEAGDLVEIGLAGFARRLAARVSSYWRTTLSAPVGGHTSVSAAANEVR